MSTGAINGTAVTVAYESGRALDNCSFTFQPGTVTALVGPNGSGKSTLLSAIAGLQPLTSGVLTVFGSEPGARGLSRRVAYVLQLTTAANYLPITVREVVEIGRFAHRGAFGRLRRSDHQIVADALEQLEVTHLANRHLRELSGGQRQRVLVAQGLAQEAEVLLLDEPMTGLDLRSTERIAEIINGLQSAGGTVVIATHDLSDAEHCDHVVLLATMIVAQGPPATVITNDNLRTAYGGRIQPIEAHPHAHHA